MDKRSKHRLLAIICALLITTISVVCIGMHAFSRNDNATEATVQKEQYIWVEACRPISIRQPLEVVAIGDNGEKGLYCAPGGHVATDDDGGDATYRFYVPAAGRYRMWGYCRWLDATGDGFDVDIGGVSSSIHKTASASQWQWLPLAEAQLSAGARQFTVKSKGGGFAVRRLFLCNDFDGHPLQCATEPVDFFFDDFDGCEEGEFDSWNSVSGQWTVHRRQDRKSPAAKLLIGKSTSEALISVGDPGWRDYSLILDCRTIHTSPGAMAAVRFCCDQEGNGIVLRWKPTDTSGKTQMELLREEVAGVKRLDRFTAAWDTSRWGELSVTTLGGVMTICIDSMPVRTIQFDGSSTGTIGLWFYGDIEMMFDNVQVIGWRDRISAVAQNANTSNRLDQEDKETDARDEEER